MTAVRRPRASLHSLGCRVNQYEVREAAVELSRRGFDLVPFGSPADVCIVNTCAVTHEAEVKSRAALRRAARCGDDPLVVATGCYSELAPEGVRAVPGVVEILPNAEKHRAAEVAEDLVRRSGRLLFPLAGPAPAGPEESELIPLLRRTGGAAGRTRAVIKIQDGCNHFCSFCIIPFTRGRLRSRPAAEVVAEAQSLADLGFREIVLTGICIGDYGDERGSAPVQGDPLARLLERLAQIPGIRRIRLSSLDPADVTDDLLATLARLPACCPHLHLSLQSGSSDVLRRMRRRYDADGFMRLVERIRAHLPGCGLTADVIAGFPGETEQEFDETRAVCRAADFLHIHCFPYSERPGTLAARLPDDVPPRVKKERVAALAHQAGEQLAGIARRAVGREVEVLLEDPDDAEGELSGLTGGFLRVIVPAPSDCRGRFALVHVERVDRTGARGRLLRLIGEAAGPLEADG